MPTPQPNRAEPKPLIVIIEDEAELAQLIAQQLEDSGMRTQICSRAEHGFKFLQRNYANLLLLDITLPDQTGLALLEQLRGEGIEVPVIFLTGNIEEPSKIHGLDLGADDYITKPFSYAELTARIRAVLRRTESGGDQKITKNVRANDEPFDFCGATINPVRLEIAFPKEKPMPLGRKEMGILAYLNAHQAAIITRKALIHAVWGVHADIRSRSLDQYIVKVRDLYEQHGLELTAFRTVHGVGYIFDPKGVSKEGR